MSGPSAAYYEAGSWNGRACQLCGYDEGDAWLDGHDPDGPTWPEVGLLPWDWAGEHRASWDGRMLKAAGLRPLIALYASEPESDPVAGRALAVPRLPCHSLMRVRGPRGTSSAVLLHEIGHHRLAQAVAAQAGRPVAVGRGDALPLDAVRQYLHPLTAPLLADPSAVPPTLYAASNANEWFAECYALHRLGRDDLLSDADLALLERVLSAVPAAGPPVPLP